MRLPFIPPSDLSPEQRPLYEDMRDGIGRSFHDFAAIREDGALMGPWNPWLHAPRIGKPIWDLVKAISIGPTGVRPPGRDPRDRRAFPCRL